MTSLFTMVIFGIAPMIHVPVLDFILNFKSNISIDKHRRKRIKADPKFAKLTKKNQRIIIHIEQNIYDGNQDLAKVLIECIYENPDFNIPAFKNEVQ